MRLPRTLEEALCLPVATFGAGVEWLARAWNDAPVAGPGRAPGGRTGPPRPPGGAAEPGEAAWAGALTAATRWVGAAAALGGELAPAAMTGMLANRLEAFSWFLGWSHPASSDEPLQARLAAAALLPAWPRMWAVEGVGAAAAAARRSGGPSADELAVATGMPGLRLPLHTGFGMGLARSRLAALPARPAAGDAERWLLELREEVCAAAAPAWRPAVFEPAGFVVWTLRPEALPALGAALDRLGPEWSRCFWHGAGRGAWFAPGDAAPDLAAPFRVAWRSSPPRHRRQALAGTAWALALVDLRHPRWVRTTLAAASRALDGVGDPALAGGLAGAAEVWAEIAAGEESVPPAEHWRRWWPGTPPEGVGWRQGARPTPGDLFGGPGTAAGDDDRPSQEEVR